jgi:hypothetical protein
MSTEAIPDLVGTDPEQDPLLLRITNTHFGPLNREQLARRPYGAPRVPELREGQPHSDKASFGIYQVPDEHWNNPDPSKREQARATVMRQLWEGSTGYPDAFYEAKDTFREDAERCYKLHGFPGDSEHNYACIDYHDDSKRLTDRAWRQRGADSGVMRNDVFLCDFCRFESVVMMRKRALRGDYK